MSAQEGQRPTIVFLRGLIRSRYHWLTFPDRFRAEFQVLEPELPGNGYLSDELTPPDIPAMMHSIRKQVREQYSGPVIIIAVSMGAMIAAEWAREYSEEISEMHLINTSLANMSMPWERMTLVAFIRLLACVGSRQKLERAIYHLTINRTLQPEETQPWFDFAEKHPLRWRNVFGQLIAASRYRGPTDAPVERVYFYNAAGDRLVRPGCTARIARRWKKTLMTHPTAGHDLPADDPDWLEAGIRRNILQAPL